MNKIQRTLAIIGTAALMGYCGWNEHRNSLEYKKELKIKPTIEEYNNKLVLYQNPDAWKDNKPKHWSFLKVIDRDKDGNPDLLTDLWVSDYYFVNPHFKPDSLEKERIETNKKIGYAKEMDSNLVAILKKYSDSYKRLWYEMNKEKWDSTEERFLGSNGLFAYDFHKTGECDVVLMGDPANFGKVTFCNQKYKDEYKMKAMTPELQDASNKFLNAYKELTGVINPPYICK